MPRRRTWQTLGILVLLLCAVCVPVLGSGWINARTGARAIELGDHETASRAFEAAAAKLPWRQDLWEAAGLAAYSANDNVRATQLLQHARQRGLLSALGWQALGSALWESGEDEAALSMWLEGTAQHPTAPELWDVIAASYHQVGNFTAEGEALRRRLQLKDDGIARYRLALVLMLSDPNEARQMLREATVLNREIAYAADTLDAAVAHAEQEADASRALVVIGRSLGLVEEWALAREAFSRAAQADQNAPEARAWLGEARQHLDQDGRPDLDAALAMGWENSVVHTLRGLYWRRQGNLGLSLAEYSRAAQLEPTNPALQSLVGEAHAASGDLVAALNAYEQAVELAPEESTYWRLLALFSADNNVQVVDLGVAAGKRAVELAPHDPQALDASGWALVQAGYLYRGESELLKALEENPNFALAHVHLGITYMRWGQNGKALEHWNAAVAIDGDGSVGRYAAQLLQAYFPRP